MSENMVGGVQVPAGRVHRGVLMARGWTSQMIHDYLPDVVKLDGVPAQVSKSFYLSAEAERVECEVAEVRAAVKARSSLIPVAGPYGATNTISRSILLARGWTVTHIKRLLGGPDHTEGYGPRTEQHFYGLDRVQLAEGTDPALQRRLAKHAVQREAEKSARVTQTVAAGFGVWRKVDGRWLVQGNALEVGQQIQVKTRNGRVEAKIVTTVTSREPDGTCIVSVADPRPARPVPTPVTEREASVATPRRVSDAPASWQVLLPYAAVGQVLQPGESNCWVVVESVRRYVIESDDPSVYGSHLLGYEGSIGVMARVRAATEAQIAPILAARTEEAERAERFRARDVVVRRLMAHVQAHGYRPEYVEQLDGDLIHSTPDQILGTGESLYARGTQVTWVHRNGMDGDNWSRNNYGGSVVLICDDVPVDLITAVKGQ